MLSDLRLQAAGFHLVGIESALYLAALLVAGRGYQYFYGMVGTGRFELPTCRLGGGRSIHLSYVPALDPIVARLHCRAAWGQRLKPLCAMSRR